ncbi:MAG: flagellar motor protein MotB, partial [Bdellovibrionota bacterium]
MAGGTKRIFKGFAKKDKMPDVRPRPQPAPSPYNQSGHSDESNWLVSYADMMTLLCGFFIMLFSMARLDEPQFENVKEAVAKQFGGEYRSSSKELAKFVKQVVQELGIESETSIKYDPAGVSITFESTIFFDTLSAEVKPAGQKILGELANKISLKEKED